MAGYESSDDELLAPPDADPAPRGRRGPKPLPGRSRGRGKVSSAAGYRIGRGGKSMPARALRNAPTSSGTTIRLPDAPHGKWPDPPAPRDYGEPRSKR